MGKRKTLTTIQVAQQYNVHYQTVIAWIRTGKIKAFKEQESRGDVWRIPASALKNFDPASWKPGKRKNK